MNSKSEKKNIFTLILSFASCKLENDEEREREREVFFIPKKEEESKNVFYVSS